MTIAKVHLKDRHEARALSGHLWVFSNEIEEIEGEPEPGGIVDVHAPRRGFVGRGFYNPHSLISVRILSSSQESIDGPFISSRVDQARKLRERLYPGETAYRLVFGESDFLPGLVIDRFNDVFVIQSYALGMDVLLPSVTAALEKTFNPRVIVAKNDAAVRTMEGLKEEVRVIKGTINGPTEITQKSHAGELRFSADILEGQKTGFFFDQRENRVRLQGYSGGKDVLDCFSYTGAFGIYAAKAQAKSATFIDSSGPACAQIRKHLEMNGVAGDVVQADAEEALEGFGKEKRKFDIIVLDPPALAKSKKNLFGALRKYQKLNELALAVLKPGGILFSCSCSHHVSRADFLSMIGQAAADAKKKVRVLEMRGPARDHPVLPAMPETEYLKCAVLEAE